MAPRPWISCAIGRCWTIDEGPQHHGGRHPHAHGQGDHNLKAAYLHVIADALTSMLAIMALVTGRFWNWIWNGWRKSCRDSAWCIEHGVKKTELFLLAVLMNRIIDAFSPRNHFKRFCALLAIFIIARGILYLCILPPLEWP